ncbi:hypothetical protein Amet_4712 [Alkaliphilus metalliredigens QYMF]|uniref:Uncharacterized protein n=1 Tax=Alkaliphilus metalliredigens (strain QYMF) TaxID=293826 RepID=A6TX62_ALKMQ|nr:hypothetical protein Amet_4712 [Alkaliphilus metalliredigens QYMF]
MIAKLDLYKVFSEVAKCKSFSKEYLQNKRLHEVQIVDAIPKRGIGFCFLKSVSLSCIY